MSIDKVNARLKKQTNNKKLLELKLIINISLHAANPYSKANDIVFEKKTNDRKRLPCLMIRGAAHCFPLRK
jgi:hypothetical protein